jgi:hypothetical protein
MPEYKDSFDTLLSELGNAMGISGMVFDEENACHFKIDEERLVIVQRDRQCNRMLLLAYVTDNLPETISSELWDEIFSQSYSEFANGNIGIGYAAQQKFVLLHQGISMNGLTAIALFEAFGNLLDSQVKWAKRFDEELLKSPAKHFASK